MTRVILDSHIISAFVLIGHLARSHPFLSDNPYPLQRGGLTEAFQNVLLMRCSEVSYRPCFKPEACLGTPTYTFVTKKRNFPFLKLPNY